jgi:hypothetical protein
MVAGAPTLQCEFALLHSCFAICISSKQFHKEAAHDSLAKRIWQVMMRDTRPLADDFLHPLQCQLRPYITIHKAYAPRTAPHLITGVFKAATVVPLLHALQTREGCLYHTTQASCYNNSSRPGAG